MSAQEIKPELTDQEVKLFQGYIEEQCGIVLDDEKGYMLQSRLKPLLAEQGVSSFGDLYRKVQTGGNSLLRTRVVDAITTNETLWFRDMGPFVTFEEVFLPEMVRQISAGKPRCGYMVRGVFHRAGALLPGHDHHRILQPDQNGCRQAGKF